VTEDLQIGIVCVAGGRGERFGGDKLASRLGSGTVLETSLAQLRRAFPSAPLVVVVPVDRLPFWSGILNVSWPGIRCVEGGVRRQDSVRRGVEAVAAQGIDHVMVHDGARPLVHPDDVRAGAEGIGSADGCIVGRPAADTLKRVDHRGVVLETVPRQTIFLAQTPQVFRIEALRKAWESGDFDREWTDEAALLESLGMRVVTVIASHPNPKLTTEGDLVVLRALEMSRS